MEKQEQQKDFFSQWGEFQKGFFSQWADSYGKMYQPWMDAMKSLQGMKMPFAAPDLFTKWSEMIQETIGKAAGKTEGGLGPDVLFRILRASNVFVIFNEFWMEVLKDLPELYKAKKDDAKSREIFEGWVNRYQKVFEQLMGSPVSDTAQEMMTSWLNILQMNQAAFGLMSNPWMQAIPQWKEHAERLMKGDLGALPEGRSLWREVYDETLGRVFRMPAFGLTKEQTERMRRTYDAFVKYWYSIPNFYQFFYNTGMEALKEVFQKVQNMKLEKMTPETMREIYKVWWITNEDNFFELFKRPDFSKAMVEVLHYGLRLKKRLDEVNAEWCDSLSIPTNREFDRVAETIQDLRRKVRAQQKAIEELQQKLEKVA
jgi:class III poly(R)-hydroxyalkanoic acid synthase PhaE subunit